MSVAAVKRIRAWLLLATFVASLGLSQLNATHLEVVDSACGAVGLATTSSTQVSTATKTGPQHCPVCHFIRAVSGATATPVASVAVQARVTLSLADAIELPTSVDAITRLSRGPPTPTPSVVL